MGISAAIASFATSIGVGAETAAVIGTVGAGALEGAAFGAGGALLTGGKPLKGAEMGALTGGIGAGISPFISSATGLSSGLSNALGYGLGGAAGAAATGQNPLTGALMGGVGGYLLGGNPGAATFDPASGNWAPGPAGFPDVSGGASGAAPAIAGAAPAAGAGGGVVPTAFDDLGNAVEFGPAATGSAIGAGAPSTAGVGAAGKAGGLGSLFGKDGFTMRDALAAGGLALSAGKKSNLPGEAQLGATAGQLGTQGAELSKYLQSGTLPPGVAQGIHTASESAKATIRSQFANMGMSGSSSEASALANVDMTAQTQGVNIAMNLLQTGIQESQLSAELYDLILRNSLEQDRELGSALTNFSTALAGGNPQQRAA